MTENPYVTHKSDTKTSHEVWNEGYNAAKNELRELVKYARWPDDICEAVDKFLEEAEP